MSDFAPIKDCINFRQYTEQHLIVKNKKALCLFHADKHPSMHIYEDSYHCFTCGATGDIFDLHMKLFNVSKSEALIELARYAGITLEPLSPEHKAKQDKRERLYAVLDKAAQVYQEQLFSKWGGFALRYLTQDRGLSIETIKSAGVGFATSEGGMLDRLQHAGFNTADIVASGVCVETKNEKIIDRFLFRIMIPLRDHKGRIVAFSGRAMDSKQTPKYLTNSATEIFNKSNLLYWPEFKARRGADGAQEGQKVLVLVEGQFDALQAHSKGLSNVCAQMGTSLSDEQLTLLCAPGITRLVFCLDNDTAGHDALKRLVVKHMHSAADKGVDLYAMTAPHGKDADDTLREHPELWQAAVDAARPVVDVLLERESTSLVSNPTPGQKQVWGLKVLPLLKGSNGFVNEDNLNKLAVYLNTTIATIEAWTRTHAVVMPKTNITPTQAIDSHLPSNEEWILHAILTHDDDTWIERANARLDTVTTDLYPYALAPLSLNDFTGKHTRMVMSQIARFVAEGKRPLHETVKGYFQGGNNYEIYERIEATEVRSRILGGPGGLDYDAFIGAVFEVRIVRLRRDIENGVSLDQGLVRECQNAIALLSLACEEMPI